MSAAVAAPAAVAGSEAQKRRAFRDARRERENRIRTFTRLPPAALDRASLQHRLREMSGARSLRTAEPR